MTADSPLTLEELAALPEEERERLNRERMERLREAAHEAARLSAEEEEAVDILADPESDDVETVELRNGVRVDVRVTLPGYVEDMVDSISEAKRIRDVRGLVSEAMAAIVVDDKYGSARVWRAYGERYGSAALFELFEVVVEPALERRERAGKFRGNR